MRIVGMIVLASLLISAAQAVIATMTLLVILSLIWCLITRPAETFGFLALCVIANVIAAWPGTTLLMAAAMAFIIYIDPEHDVR